MEREGKAKRESNSMESSFKIRDRDEEGRWRGGIWSKEMWKKVEGWRDLGWTDQESLSPSTLSTTWPNEFHDSQSCYTWTSRINMLIMYNP